GNFVPNPDGEYLAPPFIYNTCIDRDHDGLIKTSHGLLRNEIANDFAWPDSGHGLADAQDEAVIDFTEVDSYGDHSTASYVSIAVDLNDDLWVSGKGYPDYIHQKLSGNDASLLTAFQTQLGGEHGSLVDHQGHLWYTRDNDALWRFLVGASMLPPES